MIPQAPDTVLLHRLPAESDTLALLRDAADALSPAAAAAETGGVPGGPILLRAADSPAPADTLANTLADSLAATADTLAEAAAVDPTLTPDRMFGAASQLVAGEAPAIPFSEALTDHPLFQGFVLLLAVAYMLMVCAHLHDIAAMFSRKHNLYVRENGERSLNNGSAIQTAAVIGLLTAAALAVRFCEPSPFREYGTVRLLLSILGGIFGIVLFQCGVLAFVGRLTLTRDLTRAIIHFKILFFSLVTIITMPLALLSVCCPPGQGNFWFCGIVLLVGIIVLLFLKETLKLFLSKKISILHWFLYLCTVECFPISLAWLLATRC